jgi:CRISPR-associated protein Csm4
MKQVILKCKSNSQFRFGKANQGGPASVGSEIIHSDTLFSALVNICSACGDDVEDFIRQFESGEISISSGFPCIETSLGKYIYFVPKPGFYFENNEKSEGASNRKKLKKIKFVSFSFLSELFDKVSLREGNFIYSEKVNLDQVLKGIFLLTETEKVQIENKIENIHFQHITAAKTKVRSDNQDDCFYYETTLSVSGLHFYFFVQELKENSQLRKYINLLSEHGIGGGLSTGAGQFEKVDWPTQSIGLPDKPSCYYSLSLLSPSSEEEFERALNYNIVIRGGGYSQDGRERKFVRMLSEGAIFKSQEVKGRLVELVEVKDEETKVYRNGKAFLLPLCIK